MHRLNTPLNKAIATSALRQRGLALGDVQCRMRVLDFGGAATLPMFHRLDELQFEASADAGAA